MKEARTIRPAQPADLPKIMEIYQIAQRFMIEHGNASQWGTTYPPESLIAQDIRQGQSYVCEDSGEIVGVFMLLSGEEPTYRVIEDGAWPNQNPYHTIHRIASSGAVHGVFASCVSWCYQNFGTLRIDTHPDNQVMQHLIAKAGFVRCGIIHCRDGSPRIAYARD